MRIIVPEQSKFKLFSLNIFHSTPRNQLAEEISYVQLIVGSRSFGTVNIENAGALKINY